MEFDNQTLKYSYKSYVIILNFTHQVTQPRNYLTVNVESMEVQLGNSRLHKSLQEIDWTFRLTFRLPSRLSRVISELHRSAGFEFSPTGSSSL
jgi:hypothetical protein